MRDRRSPRKDAQGRATESRGPHVLLVAWLNRKQGLTERYRDTVNGTGTVRAGLKELRLKNAKNGMVEQE